MQAIKNKPALALADHAAVFDHATKVLDETRKDFIPLPTSIMDHVPASMDRITAMDITGDADVLEVLMVRKNEIIARWITGERKGVKVVLPFGKMSGFGPMVGMSQYHLYTKAAVTPASDAPAPGVKRVKADGPTKIELCRAIYARNPALPKEEMKALFVSEAKCTPAGANTYYLTCKKG